MTKNAYRFWEEIEQANKDGTSEPDHRDNGHSTSRNNVIRKQVGFETMLETKTKMLLKDHSLIVYSKQFLIYCSKLNKKEE